MLLKDIVAEDFTNYYQASMFLIFPHCSFKCDKECGKALCQNSLMAKQPNIEISTERVLEMYLANPITKALVFGGLEPFDSFNDVLDLISKLRIRHQRNDPVIIYTGFNKDEITRELEVLKRFKNIIIKFGRYIPNQTPHLDPVLQVYLASDNQFAEKL